MRIVVVALLLLLAAACRKDLLYENSDAKVQFSTDTLLFDTVFTTVGSITERIKIYNPYDEPLVLDRVWLKTGNASNFRLNVNGRIGKFVDDVRIEAQDSIFVFVEVTVDPNGGTQPMVIEDQLLVNSNGNVQDVDLVAWGQDAYFFASSRFRFDGPVSLFTDKPNVFYGYSLIDTGTTLIIPCGAQVHFHPNGGLIAGYEASLKILGCVDDPVVIQGDRLEGFYDDLPGQWQQILLSATSVDNEIRNAIIKNGSIGIRVDSNTNANPTLVLENTQILNMSYYGLLGQTARIEATNTVVANCGDHAVALAYGGVYRFNHCTFANYFSQQPRSEPVLLLNNYFKLDGTTYARDLDVEITNSIVHGSMDSELERDFSDKALHRYVFDHVVMKLDTENTDDSEKFIELIVNPSGQTVDDTLRDPLFENRAFNNYKLNAWSRAIDGGKASSVLLDLEGNARDAAPDLGAYELVP